MGLLRDVLALHKCRQLQRPSERNVPADAVNPPGLVPLLPLRLLTAVGQSLHNSPSQPSGGAMITLRLDNNS